MFGHTEVKINCLHITNKDTAWWGEEEKEDEEVEKQEEEVEENEEEEKDWNTGTWKLK